jgi:hypothetical protein
LPFKLFAFCIKNDISLVKKDTTKYSIKDWITTPRLQADRVLAITNKLLTEDSLYTQNWSNASVFINQKTTIADLPELIKIPLVDSNHKFQLTWYGKLNSKYGPRWGSMHKGLDLFLRKGDTVVSAFNGVVRYAKFNSGGYGNCIVVRHTNGLETIYGHLSQIDVVENQYVQAGELLGLGGTTGHSSGPHLHFETRYKDFAIDPEQYYDTETGQLLSNMLVVERDRLSANRYPIKKGKKSKHHKKSHRKQKTTKKNKASTAVPKKTRMSSTKKKLNASSKNKPRASKKKAEKPIKKKK